MGIAADTPKTGGSGLVSLLAPQQPSLSTPRPAVERCGSRRPAFTRKRMRVSDDRNLAPGAVQQGDRPGFRLLVCRAILGAALTSVGLLGVAARPAAATTEIATGSMLGPRYKQKAFYMRRSPRGEWRQTYTERGYRGKARGKLMVLRLAQGIFHDEWMTEHEFDPDVNTNRLIEALDVYKQHGVLAVSVSLQGGNPGYDPKVNGISRRNGAKHGGSEGMLVSAFLPDGSLKPAWLARLERVIRAADERGMIVNLMYFYQGQDEIFESEQAIDDAARNVTRWLVTNNFRNVVIDIANEWDLKGETWDQAAFIPENITGLVEVVREQFNGADFLLPIGASTGGRMAFPASLARLCDVVLVHGNGRTPGEKLARLREFDDYNRTVWMTEDDNGRETTHETLARELASADALFNEAAGWGYMPWVQAQQFPFVYMPGESAEFSDDMPVAQRDPAYFKAVLEHIASLVLRKPPDTTIKKKN